MIAKPSHSLRRIQGFTLVEVMVALVIGMISMLVVLQIFSASEGLKRSTTGGDDAQIAGALGLFELERDLSQAGYGISSTGLIGCNVLLPNGTTTVTLAPVTINPATTLLPGGDTNTDTLLIAYGNPVGPTEGDLIMAQPSSPTVFQMQTAVDFYYKSDYVIAAQVPPTNPANASNCAGLLMDTVKITPVALSLNLTVTTGVPSVQPQSRILYDLGQAPVIVGYAVRKGNLTTCNYMNATTDCTNKNNWSNIAGNITSLRALYGHDNNAGNMNAIVDTWDQTPPPTTCSWLRTSAVSVALVARNSEFSASSPPVTSAAPSWWEPAWTGATVTWAGATTTAPIPIDLSANIGLATGATWQNYRYKIYSSVVPLHNIAFTGAVTGC